MGLFDGSVTYRRFLIEPQGAFDNKEQVEHLVNKFAFRPLQDDDVSSQGWVDPFDYLETSISSESLFRGSYLFLALRIDQRRIPPTLFKSTLLKETKAYLKREGRDRLSKKEKEIIKENVTKKLISGVLPDMKVLEAYINIETSQCYFFSASESAFAKFEEWFKETFKVYLVPWTFSTHRLFGETNFQDEDSVRLFEENLDLINDIEPDTFNRMS